MAKEPADGETGPEKAPSPPEKQRRSSPGESGGLAAGSGETGPPAVGERETPPGGAIGEPDGATPAAPGSRGDEGRDRQGRDPDDRHDRDQRSDDRRERDQRSDDRYDRDRRGDDRYERDRRGGDPDDRYDRDRWNDDGYGRDRRDGGRYERGRRSDDRYDRDRRDDDGYGRDRRYDDRYDRAPRFDDADVKGFQPGPPTTPAGAPGPPRRRRFRRFRLAAWIALVLAAVVVGVSIAWVNGPPTEAELREKAGLLNKDRLLIGVKEDTPGIALREPGGTGFTGFDIDIAYMIAADLGFRPDQVDFLAIETEDRARMQARDTDGTFVKVDLVVATFSVTPERRADPSVGFSTPYLYTEQSVVTRADYPDDNVASLGQLEGRKVCSLGTSTSLAELRKAIKTDPIAELLISKCVDRLADGVPSDRAAEAVTTDAALLAGFVAQPERKLRHHDIALEKTEMWAVNAGSNRALRTLVDLALYRSYADPGNKMWEEAYEKHIRPLLAANPGVDVAQAQQPCALPPDVRRWPWERTLPVRDCPSAP
ncbi:transporter substrate-binding domain-containing protein [Streptosporangium sp. NPDC000563]|uniref:transporter substrate-binding domain-containing protein n=1 Tax=Streptosporangium sp. NPDC000563 TaxID=3154366 RepID=UPI003316CFCB